MPINDSFTEIISKEGHNKGELTPYLIFKYAIKTEITIKYYDAIKTEITVKYYEKSLEELFNITVGQ